MKKLIIIALLVVGLSSFAQNRKEIGNRPNRDGMEKMSPEQRNQLMLKKMTLELDLNVKQQEQAKQIITEHMTKSEAIKAELIAKKADEKRPTAEERFTMKNKILDEQIAMQNKMKTILSPEQLKKWDSQREKQKESFQKRRHEMKE